MNLKSALLLVVFALAAVGVCWYVLLTDSPQGSGESTAAIAHAAPSLPEEATGETARSPVVPLFPEQTDDDQAEVENAKEQELEELAEKEGFETFVVSSSWGTLSKAVLKYGQHLSTVELDALAREAMRIEDEHTASLIHVIEDRTKTQEQSTQEHKQLDRLRDERVDTLFLQYMPDWPGVVRFNQSLLEGENG